MLSENAQAQSGERLREWSALILGAVGTVTGCLSLVFVWLEREDSKEALAISVKVERTGYPSIIQSVPYRLVEGTIGTRWHVWVTNLSTEPVSIVADDIGLLIPDQGRVGYSSMFVGWFDTDGQQIFPYPFTLQPGDNLTLVLGINFPVASDTVEYAMGSSNGTEIAVNDVGQFWRQQIIDTGRDIFGNEIESIGGIEPGEAIFSFPVDLDDRFVVVSFVTARGSRFCAFGRWYEMYDLIEPIPYRC